MGGATVIDFARHYDTIDDLEEAFHPCVFCGCSNTWSWDYMRCKNCWLEVHHEMAYDNYGEYEKYYVSYLVVDVKPYRVFIANYNGTHFSDLAFNGLRPIHFPFGKFELIKNWHNKGILGEKIDSLLVLA
jgi:hypothetical protein